ncbi:MAG TPA: biotin--[acetyl-CoA-carboxylase] ligase, partial [Chloroflexi bacterium]|nr:biotin--[acetyl-CoA-carboxylase] ligase [Chloroflexota bacterium]
LRTLLRLLDKEYESLEAGGSPYQRWAARLTGMGQAAVVSTPAGQETGIMEGVDTDGALILRRAGGSVARITVGEVS